MVTREQPPHPSGRVVSVRLPPDIIQHLDAPAVQTTAAEGRIRLVLHAMLPALETEYWEGDCSI